MSRVLGSGTFRAEVLALLQNALRRMVFNRLEDGTFTDEQDVRNERYYFSTLEGLDAILIPLVNLPRSSFWDVLNGDFPGMITAIGDDVNFIIRSNPENREELPPPDHGRPYFRQEQGRRAYWTSECASFTISVLTNYLRLREILRVSRNAKPYPRDVVSVIRQNLEWVARCMRGNAGWAWVFDSAEHAWPTWSLLDTFDEVLRDDAVHSQVQESLPDVKSVVDRLYSSISVSGDLRSYFTKMVNRASGGEQGYDPIAALDLVRLMLAISLHKPGREIQPMAQVLFSWAQICGFANTEYRYHLKERYDYVVDSSLVPSVLRCLIVMSDLLGAHEVAKLDKLLGRDHEETIHRVYLRLLDDIIVEGKYKGLWGVRLDGALTYELYYTERAIEALTEALIHFKSGRDRGLRSGLKKQKFSKLVEEQLKEREGKKAKRQPPNDIDQYTTWIPRLASGEIPMELGDLPGWRVEDLLEFYVYRLLNTVLSLNGTQWGYRERGERLPDGRFTVSRDRMQILYDVKSRKHTYDITADELRRLKEYLENGKELARPLGFEVKFFLLIAREFSGPLNDRANEFRAKLGASLVCIRTEDLCNFARRVMEQTTNPSTINLIEWAHLLSAGKPLLDGADFDRAYKRWEKQIARMTDL